MEDNQVQAPDQADLGGNEGQQDGNTLNVAGSKVTFGDGNIEGKVVSGGQLEGKTFTQDDVSGLVAKETKKAQEKLLKSLGVTDFNTAKEGLQKYNEMIESQKTDQQRKDDELATYQTQAQQAEEKATLLESKLAAFELNVNADDLEDVLVLAKAKGKDDIKEAIAEVIARYPHFTTQPANEDTPAPKYTTGQHKKDSPDTSELRGRVFGRK